MKAALAAAALIVAAPTLALSAPMLTNPADADRDGVVTDDERADYLAKKAAGVQNTPGLPVSAPKPGGNTTVFKPLELTDDDDLSKSAAGAPPSQASDFERSVESRVRKDAKDD